MDTEQSHTWRSSFGDFYLNRNPQNLEELNNLYLNNFGVSREELNERFLKDLPRDIKILEVGCNIGLQLFALKKMGFTNLTGIEISENAIAKSKEIIPEAKIIQANALNIPFPDNSFDLVFTSGVLIHISPENLPKIINEIYRVSKRYIFGYEYFSETCEEIIYHGKENLLWKNNFMRLFLDRHPDLKIIKEKKLNYLYNENIDQMYLIEKI